MTHPTNAIGIFGPNHFDMENYHISLRQVEDPDEQAGIWPPPHKIHWELRAMGDNAAEPFLDVLLRFEPPSAWPQPAATPHMLH